MSDKIRTYLGDGLYAKWENSSLVLYAWNGIETTSTVYLGPEVLSSLLVWLKQFIKDPQPTTGA